MTWYCDTDRDTDDFLSRASVCVAFIYFRYVFLPNIGEKRPQMLIFESATPQKFGEAIHLAIKNDIILVVLPGGKGTHFTQPVGAMLSKVVKKFTSIAY